MPLILTFIIVPTLFAPETAQASDELCAYTLNSKQVAIKNKPVKGSAQNSTNLFQRCWYGTFGLGLSTLDPEGSGGWSSNENTSISADIHLGFHFSPHWLAELNYTYIGEAELNNINPVIDDDVDGKIAYYGPSILLGYRFL
ncbi:MAG: hypothetical protein ACI9T7_000793, partial [Oleiphilaceae bacterium]